MNLYTDDNPETTLKGLGFKNALKALETIRIVEKYFDKLEKSQKIPGFTPKCVLPKTYINNKIESKKYYQKQKLYRILGMQNRAKGMVNRIKNNKNILLAIDIFQNWLDKHYSQKGGTENCCTVDETKSHNCIRTGDNKVFRLPRRFSRKRCKEGIKGFTMRSSCAPYKNCL
tara:strand:+ start:80 stop:595 length:516 start_codon:yes stop_codon:yes gene_type:complete